MHRRQGARERRGVERDTEIQPSPPLQGDAYGEQIPRVVDETIAYLEHSCVSQPSLFFGEPSVREINDLIDAIRDAPPTPPLPAPPLPLSHSSPLRLSLSSFFAFLF